MASVSSNQPSQRSFGGGSSTTQDRPLLSTMNLDILRTLTEKRTTRDGQPQKRRGPKPDSKPALTRRQELNRQAQRTHRERKELYIRALEDEVLRLKEIFSHVSQDKERLAEENRQLKAILAQNGLGVGALIGRGGGGGGVGDDSVSNPSVGYSPSSSMAGSYIPASSNTTALTPPPLSASNGSHGGGGGMSPHSAAYSHGGHHQHHPSVQGNPSAGAGVGSHPNQNLNLDYEQAGIDFVLTLEKPCMNHLPWMLERNSETGGREPCGHALMASCPPQPFSQLSSDIPFSHHQHQLHQPQQQAQQQQRLDSQNNNNNTTNDSNYNVNIDNDGSSTPGTWTLNKGDLATLLDLSRRLNLDGEITPVMAWGMVLAHPRLGELRAEDFARLAEELLGKVRCYGFGAVLEEFEVRDALENIFSTKPDFGTGY
ncbi:uncharacterized protein THITE_2112534 [Thermothielavioides terrestris NRRL 8126]|uniref:BZIP domain-containing protein n=1 Tax=Thermothielavioides terrestris (strain ATCC 38088 / NRRL 8126) TaxID=578455 RepID=G2QZF9_THETT|nr:uncharacterized protein THITE_2112534 [Thermothielavioides terrestris NRRL 8126]AEO65485.1 hypothetical protein THITE_2112534 [Thermothielavioides terrestris NRRL 8126]